MTRPPATASSWRMGEEMLGSVKVNTGATILFEFNDEMWELVEEVDPLEDKLLRSGRSTDAGSYTDNGEMVYLTEYGTPMSKRLTCPAIGERDRQRLPRILPDLALVRETVDPCLAHTAAEFDDENVPEYLLREVGEDFLENYVEPESTAPAGAWSRRRSRRRISCRFPDHDGLLRVPHAGGERELRAQEQLRAAPVAGLSCSVASRRCWSPPSWSARYRSPPSAGWWSWW